MLQKAAIVLMLLSLSFLAAGSMPDQDKLSCYVTLQPTDSLQQAVDMVPPFATICLQPGIYQQGDIKVDNAWLTVRGAGTGKTLIFGSFSVSWSGDLKARGRSAPSTREVRFQDLTVLAPDSAYAAILTIYSSQFKPGRIILEGVELLGNRVPPHSCSNTEGVILVNDMELVVRRSALYRFKTAIGTYDYDIIDANPVFKIKISDSTFFENCMAILATGGSLELVGSRIEHNGIGMLLRTIQALIQKTTIAEQGGGGIAIGGDSHVLIEDSQIVRNGMDMLWKPAWDQALELYMVLGASGISIGGKLSSEGEKPKIMLSIRRSMIQENVGWGIGAALAKCGNFAGEDEEFDVQLTLDNTVISNNNRNWLLEGDICLPW